MVEKDSAGKDKERRMVQHTTNGGRGLLTFTVTSKLVVFAARASSCERKAIGPRESKTGF